MKMVVKTNKNYMKLWSHIWNNMPTIV